MFIQLTSSILHVIYNYVITFYFSMVKRLESWTDTSLIPTDITLCSSFAPRVDNSKSDSSLSGEGLFAIAYSNSDDRIPETSPNSVVSGAVAALEEDVEMVSEADRDLSQGNSQQNSEASSDTQKVRLPEFPLLPASKGFCITMKKNLKNLQKSLDKLGMSSCNHVLENQ